MSQEQWAKKKKVKKAEVTAEGSEHTWLNTCPRGRSTAAPVYRFVPIYLPRESSRSINPGASSSP